MELEHTTKERERAFAKFKDVASSHAAARMALGLLATLPDANELLAAYIKLQVAGAQPDISFSDLAATAEKLTSIARDERDEGYQTLWETSLMASCGAFEYLLKAVLVDQAAYDPGRASDLLVASKVKLSAAEVIGLTATEQWYVVADRLFESLAAPFPLTHQRSIRMLLDHVHLPLGETQQEEIQAVLSDVEVKRFNEAFLIRNCLVHNGGRVSSSLARYARLQKGELIKLGKQQASVLLSPITKLAHQINGLWLVL